MYKFNNFTLEDAKATSEEFIKKLGISNMSCEYYSIKSQHDNFIDYKLVYTKKYDSLSQTYTTQEIQHDSADIYTAPWKYEELIISVDNTGVYDFLWNSPTKVTKTLSDSVKLLSFNKTMDIFKNQIQFKVVWDNKEDAIIDRKLFIDEIRLGMMRVNIKDSIDEYMVIPVYDFFGEEVLTYSDKQPGGYILDENNQCVSRKERFSYITINAIDGSIINRELGY
jgi:hypothetical protein